MPRGKRKLRESKEAAERLNVKEERADDRSLDSAKDVHPRVPGQNTNPMIAGRSWIRAEAELKMQPSGSWDQEWWGWRAHEDVRKLQILDIMALLGNSKEREPAMLSDCKDGMHPVDFSTIGWRRGVEAQFEREKIRWLNATAQLRDVRRRHQALEDGMQGIFSVCAKALLQSHPSHMEMVERMMHLQEKLAAMQKRVMVPCGKLSCEKAAKQISRLLQWRPVHISICKLIEIAALEDEDYNEVHVPEDQENRPKAGNMLSGRSQVSTTGLEAEEERILGILKEVKQEKKEHSGRAVGAAEGLGSMQEEGEGELRSWQREQLDVQIWEVNTWVLGDIGAQISCMSNEGIPMSRCITMSMQHSPERLQALQHLRYLNSLKAAVKHSPIVNQLSGPLLKRARDGTLLIDRVLEDWCGSKPEGEKAAGFKTHKQWRKLCRKEGISLGEGQGKGSKKQRKAERKREQERKALEAAGQGTTEPGLQRGEQWSNHPEGEPAAKRSDGMYPQRGGLGSCAEGVRVKSEPAEFVPGQGPAFVNGSKRTPRTHTLKTAKVKDEPS